MQPRGPLMIEHRNIERMIFLIDKEVVMVQKINEIERSFLNAAVDFIRFYADRTHHGKEEEILFRDLCKKKLSDVDNQMMHELIQEHIVGRSTTAELANAADAYQQGDKAALSLVISNLRKLADFYPKHIEKEDKLFFPASMAYFTEKEQQTMLDEFWEFDRKMIHLKYKSIVESLEK